MSALGVNRHFELEYVSFKPNNPLSDLNYVFFRLEADIKHEKSLLAMERSNIVIRYKILLEKFNLYSIHVVFSFQIFYMPASRIHMEII